MDAKIDLIWLGTEPPRWEWGRALAVEPSPAGLARCVDTELSRSSAEAWLFWGARLGAPDPRRIQEAWRRPGDVWHAGLRLGMRGLPAAIDHVDPTWMLNRDPEPDAEATSWRVSLEACLVRRGVLESLRGPQPEFESLAGAALELGHRWVTLGALTRHVPDLLPGREPEPPVALPMRDELRFIDRRYGRFWLRWSLMRSALEGRFGPAALLRHWRAVRREDRPSDPAPYVTAIDRIGAPSRRRTVTILIPTVDRYPYLRTLLDQLRRQTESPLEILIVDQTPKDRRDASLAQDFSDLPLRVFQLDRAGQCSSRNLGILESRGECVLFLDDDDEVPPDLVERHLAALERFRNDVSSGVAEEDGAGALPEAFRRVRASDVFPTNNSLIARGVLKGSGLFDLAYDRGARADGDLGMRIYLSGALMVLDPSISVLHHHAPSGGLRVHKARVVTYASSRQRLTVRHLPAVTEIYLARRYFTPRQVREMLWLATFGTFSVRGGRARRVLKAAIAAALLPHSLWEIRRRRARAEAMLRSFPQIPALAAESSEPAEGVAT